jgi:CheY-like chemotaxis protein
MEEKLRQVQKLEAVGQLTAGIAHDFNNLLTVILGNLELLERFHPEGEDAARSTRIARCIATATDGARRAAALTRRLLAFSRQQALELEPVDVSKLIDRVWELLRRTLGESIDIRTKVMPDLGFVFADANELENAIINLAVNARDAMPSGGLLTIEAMTVNSVPVQHRDGGDGEGRYVRFIVSDTGVGMSPELLSRVFEPFFTTKGRGTGLGLSQVYGFVTQSNGYIAIDSRPGFGTSVNIYLPEVTATGADRPAVADTEIAADDKCSDVILVVEDDYAVRAFSVDVLRSYGYSILEATNASDALRVLESRSDIALLFTDVGLPGVMNGWQLSAEAQQRYPRLKVLATTAYLRDAPAYTRAVDRDIAILTKPFTYNALAKKVQDLLEK